MKQFKFSLFMAILVLFCHHVASHHKKARPLPKCTPNWCLPGELCRMSKDGKPECSCPVVCGFNLSPVCGSNNVTYSNLCEFRRAICAKGDNITLSHGGACEPLSTDRKMIKKKKIVCKEVDDLSDVEVDKPQDIALAKSTTPTPVLVQKPKGKIIKFKTTTLAPAEVNPSPEPKDKPTTITPTTQAPPKVEPKSKPENKVTYTPRKVKTVSEPDNETIENTTRAPEAEAKAKAKSRPKDIAYKRQKRCFNNCPQTRNPQCGSDGVSYDNGCELKLSSCKRNETIIKAYDGMCARGIVTPLETTCANVECDFRKKCLIKNGYAHCQCSKECDNPGGSLCGSDDNNYSDNCDLEYDNCMEMKNVFKVKDGNCGRVTPPYGYSGGGYAVSETYDTTRN